MIKVIEFSKHVDMVRDEFDTVGSKCDFLVKSSSSFAFWFSHSSSVAPHFYMYN